MRIFDRLEYISRQQSMAWSSHRNVSDGNYEFPPYPDFFLSSGWRMDFGYSRCFTTGWIT